MKIVFMGTPGFAVPSLDALIDSEYEVVGVVTKADKPQGRGQRIESPPIKILSQQYGIPVLQPEKLRSDEFFNELKIFNPDLICVTAYGKILPKNVLELPPYGCINVHASLLPKYRGAAPINWAIINGEKNTGVTTMLMDEGMDTGDILLQREMPIDEEDTGETLSEKLSHIGAEVLIQTIKHLKEDRLTPIPQDHTKATYAPVLKKEDGKIDWGKPAEDIKNLIRGNLPWPGAYTFLDGKNLKIYRAKVTKGKGTPGQVITSTSKNLIIGTGYDALEIHELQIEGGKRITIEAFLSGRKIKVGIMLSS